MKILGLLLVWSLWTYGPSSGDWVRVWEFPTQQACQEKSDLMAKVGTISWCSDREDGK